VRLLHHNMTIVPGDDVGYEMLLDDLSMSHEAFLIRHENEVPAPAKPVHAHIRGLEELNVYKLTILSA
jgi:hypothetical protein